jgi:hypothetical protein
MEGRFERRSRRLTTSRPRRSSDQCRVEDPAEGPAVFAGRSLLDALCGGTARPTLGYSWMSLSRSWPGRSKTQHPVRAATHRPDRCPAGATVRAASTGGTPERHLPRTAHLHLQRTAGAVHVGAGDGSLWGDTCPHRRCGDGRRPAGARRPPARAPGRRAVCLHGATHRALHRRKGNTWAGVPQSGAEGAPASGQAARSGLLRGI